jgi:O-antigen/teichoic acid export membrane protein
LKYFAIWSALADFGIYVIALNILWKISDMEKRLATYHKFLWFRFFMVFVVYITAFLIAYLIPSYIHNPFILHGLLIWMLFSATFMLAWIVQLPLQLNWQMKQVSIALILARIVQIITLILVIFVFFPKKIITFERFNVYSLLCFLSILFTVLLSGFTQFMYVFVRWCKFMKFRLNFDFSFIKRHLKQNWKYGLSYYLSSFHTLIVLIFFSILFPTKKWFTYVWIWALALSLIEILLIVPSAFWNSIIHKISSYEKEKKLLSLGYFWTFIVWFGFFMLFNFVTFKTQIISLIAWKQYLTYSGRIWADFVLPFLAVVLFLSFIKQVFNYVLVSFDKQNKLFGINLIWVIIWVIVWIIFIPRYALYGWILTQLILEICFVIWALLIAKKYRIFPKVKLKYFFYSFLFFVVFMLLGYFLPIPDNKFLFIIFAWIINVLYLLISYKLIRKLMKSI